MTVRGSPGLDADHAGVAGLVQSPGARDEERAVQSLLGYRCGALILIGPTLPRAAIEELAERLPVVVWHGPCALRAADVVRTDDFSGARIAASTCPVSVTSRSSTSTAVARPAPEGR